MASGGRARHFVRRLDLLPLCNNRGVTSTMTCEECAKTVEQSYRQGTTMLSTVASTTVYAAVLSLLGMRGGAMEKAGSLRLSDGWIPVYC